jgi:hypothetical protein
MIASWSATYRVGSLLFEYVPTGSNGCAAESTMRLDAVYVSSWLELHA